MRERVAAFGAAAGLIAIAAVGAFRARPSPLVPKVISQRVLSASDFNLPGVEIQFLPPENRPKPDPDDDEDPIEYRVVDRGGRVYATVFKLGPEPVRVSVPRTYIRPVERPRLVALIDGKPCGSTDLAPFPEPAVRNLRPEADSRILALRQGGSTTGVPTQVDVAFRPRVPLSRDEVWNVKVIATNVALESDASRATYRIVPDATEVRFSPPYAQDVEAVRLKVVRQRRHVLSQDVEVPGLRLGSNNGHTTITLEKPFRIANRLGLSLSVKVPARQPEEPMGKRIATLEVVTDGASTMQILPPEIKGVPWIYNGVSSAPYLLQLIGPMPEELGLYALQPFVYFGTKSSKPRQPGLRKEPFTLRLRLRKTVWEDLGSFEATIPVESAPAR